MAANRETMFRVAPEVHDPFQIRPHFEHSTSTRWGSGIPSSSTTRLAIFPTTCAAHTGEYSSDHHRGSVTAGEP